MRTNDLLTTFTEHIAMQIGQSLSHLPKGKLLITGGGALNKYLVERIQHHTKHHIVIPDRQIIEYKEALILLFRIAEIGRKDQRAFVGDRRGKRQLQRKDLENLAIKWHDFSYIKKHQTIQQINKTTIQQHVFLLQIQAASNDLAATAATMPVETMEQPTEYTLSILELATKGGWIMVVLAILSVLAVYIFIERFLTVSRATKYDTNFMERIREYMKDGKIDSAKALCRGNSTPISRMIEKGLSRLGRPLNDINSAIENVGNLEVSQLEKGVSILAMIASAAPMLGFLGTVTGMIRAFYNMSMAGNNIDIELLSSGIYEAMVTTVGGLIVGIIAYIFHAIITNRIQKVVYLLEAKATEFMDVLNEPA